MSARDRVITLINTLHTNRELIADLYLNQETSVFDPSLSLKTIQKLQQHKLIWNLDDEDRIHLSSTLSKLIDNAFQFDRVMLSGATAVPLYDEICTSMTHYRVAKTESDRGELKRRIRENCIHFIQTLQEDISWFSRYIERGYGMIDSFEIRLSLNKRVIEKAEKLKDLLENIDMGTLQKQSGGDIVLRPLFYRYLPQARTSGLKELRNIVANLRHLMTRILEEKEISSLVLAFVNYYEQHPDFVPEEPFSLFSERQWHLSSPGMTPAFPPIHDDECLEDLTSLLAQLHLNPKEQSKTEDTADRAMTDNRSHEVVEVVPDVFYQAAAAMLSVVEEDGVVLMASNVYEQMQFQEEYELWLFALSNYLFGLPETQRARISVDYTEIEDAVFTGNSIVTDIKVCAV
ncbi:hypothetical protein GCM10023116_32480 [Kistimonas scapharcae]|uniref:Uncharacterized protein n=1 Tax=Kistimonas scapharcae TaxID=1036133 RepID=A0ABP8V6V7_9GAMM